MAEHQKRLLTILLLLFFAITVSEVIPVGADIPVVTNITPWKRQTDNHTFLNITVTHHDYFSGHFVNKIQVSIDGIFRDITIEAISPVDQRSSSTFIVPCDVGVISGTPTVQAMAYCSIHGPSTWSNSVEIPEFPTTQIVIIVAFLMVVVMLLRHKNMHMERTVKHEG